MKRASCISILLFLCSLLAGAQTVRVGIIGLDTSHSVAFTSQINDPQSTDPRIMKYEVVAAYPYGTRTIPSATDRIPIFVQEIQRYGVRIVDSIAELLSCVDCVLLETNDGNLHLEQAAEVFASGRKIYIDKPLGATLAQAIALYELAERYGIRFFWQGVGRGLLFSPCPGAEPSGLRVLWAPWSRGALYGDGNRVQVCLEGPYGDG